MCQLGYVKESVVVPKDKPVTLYRWFKIKSDYYENKSFKSRIVKKIVDFNRVSIGSLTSHGKKGCWMKPTAKANLEPNEYGKYGLYGYSSKSAALADRPSTAYYVLAKIRVWGKCIKHSNGMRAQFAQIEAFYPESKHSKENLVVERKLVKVKNSYYPYNWKDWSHKTKVFTFKEIAAHNKFLKTIPIRKLRK